MAVSYSKIDGQLVRVARGVLYTPPPEPIYNYVRFESDTPRKILPKYTNAGVTLQYSIDMGLTWVTAPHNVETPEVASIWFRGQATGTKSLFSSEDPSNAWGFYGSSLNELHVYGNLLYLLCDNLGDEEVDFEIGSYAFNYMFYTKSALKSISPIYIKNATTDAFSNMFNNSGLEEISIKIDNVTQNGALENFMGGASLKKAVVEIGYSVEYGLFRMFENSIQLNDVTLIYAGNNPNVVYQWLLNVYSTGTLRKSGLQFAPNVIAYPTAWTQIQI